VQLLRRSEEKASEGEERFEWQGQFGFLGFIKQRFFLFRNEKVAK
jgi:hypothetical protein